MFRLAVLLLLLGSGVARADVIPWDFGSPVPLDAKAGRDIALQSETFRAQIFYDTAMATASYRFRNAGAGTTVKMAFAGEQPRGEKDMKGASYLRVRVDGKSARFRRESKGKMFDSVVRYVGDVRFERGQSRIMQVEIRTQKFWSYGFSADLSYKFAGPKWKGQTRSDIGVELRAPGTFIVSGFRSDSEDFDASNAVALQATAGRCRFTSAEKARGFLTFSLDATSLPDWLTREGIENKASTIQVPGAARGLYSAAFWAPPAVVKAGVTYLNIYDYAEDLADSSKIKVNLDSSEDADKCTLRVGNHELQVTRGNRNARLDGRAFRLKAAPFTATSFDHDSGGGEVMYVPLLDVARALGGSADVDQKAHRFGLKLPAS